ncbi:MAG: hypothetical protein HOO96_45020, partial [Polyangiaceae bacterium]|nr:hypothetical protein [Polyangiaceae bacterium]
SVPTDATDVARAFAGRLPERAPSGVSSSSPPQARVATLRSAPPPTMRLTPGPSLPPSAPRGLPAGALLGAGALVLLATLAGLGAWTFTRSHAVAAPEPPRRRNDDLRAATPIVLGSAGAPSVTSTPRAGDPSRPHTQPTAEVAPTAPPPVPTAATASSAASTTPASCDPPWIIDGLGHRRYRPECLH